MDYQLFVLSLFRMSPSSTRKILIISVSLSSKCLESYRMQSYSQLQSEKFFTTEFIILRYVTRFFHYQPLWRIVELNDQLLVLICIYKSPSVFFKMQFRMA